MNKFHLAAIVPGLVILPPWAEASEIWVLSAGSGAAAAYTARETTDEGVAAGPMEEVIVRGSKDDSSNDLDERYEELSNKALIDEFDRLYFLEDAEGWRSSTSSAFQAANAPRFSWGYDPYDEMRLRDGLDSGVASLPANQVRPATLFRIKF